MVALVTGANRGIGLEVCRQLARRGIRVVLTARDRHKGEQAARSIQPTGELVVVELDVTSRSSIERARAEVEARAGNVDILVNNAAVLVAEHTQALDLSLDNLRTTFETNLFGAIVVSQAFVPGMIERRFGRVINVSSGAGQLSTMSAYAPAYSMSKAALNAFTRQLAAQTSGTGVLVNSMSPGWVRTDMGGPAAPRSVEQGADTIVWLGTLPAGARGPNGQFFSDRQPIDW